MRSMTGFAVAEERNDQRDLAIEIKSVNNRYLDISVGLPSFLMPLEADIKKAVATVARRGKIEVSIRFREYREDVRIHVDEGAVRAAVDALNRIGAVAGIETTPTIGDILRFEGIVQSERLRDPEEYREPIMAVLDRALRDWDQTRSREGAATLVDIRHHLDRLRHAADLFTAAAPEVEQQILDSIRSRFREVLGDEAEEQRIYAEAAAMIIKHSTNEEVVRFRSHIDGFEELLRSDESVGKRIDFLCQEMNREINTTAGKTILPSVQHAVVEAKDAVEAIREQVRNLE